jgi:hypothetical protein
MSHRFQRESRCRRLRAGPADHIDPTGTSARKKSAQASASNIDRRGWRNITVVFIQKMVSPPSTV